MIEVYKGKYYTAKDATNEIDIVGITKECENLSELADDLFDMNNKTAELNELCNENTLRVYQNTMTESIEKYGIKIVETAEETQVLADRVLSTATQLYVDKQEAYNREAMKKEDKKLRKIAEEKAKKAAKKGKPALVSGFVESVGHSAARKSFGEAMEAPRKEAFKSFGAAVDGAVKSGLKDEAKGAKYKRILTGNAVAGADDNIVYDEEKIDEAQQLVERINDELADLDDRLYVTLRKLANTNGFDLIEDKNSEIDIRVPEKMMMENRSDVRNIGNTLTNLISLLNILDTGTDKKAKAETEASTPEQHYIATTAPTTVTTQPTSVAATVAQTQPATQPGTIAPPTVANTVQQREGDVTTQTSTLTGNSGSISGTSTSAPTSTVLPASPISFDSSIPDTSSNSKVLGGYAIPAAAGIAAGIGGLGIAHKIKRDKEDEALFGDEALEQEFAQEFNNQVQEVPEEKKFDDEPIRDDKDIYKFFK